MGIIGRMFVKNVKELGESITEGIIKLDPDTASEAQIDELDGQFTEMSIQLAEAEESLKKEKAEAVAAEASYDKKVAAAEILQNKINAATDPNIKTQLEASLGTLLTQIEAMLDDVKREKEEADDAEALRDQLKTATAEMAENLKQVRSALEQAKRRNQQAAMRANAAEKSAEMASKLAGIKQSGSKFNKVLDTLNKSASAHEAKASAAAVRANLLKPASDGDENIAAALREAEGTPPKADLAARLAALKNK